MEVVIQTFRESVIFKAKSQTNKRHKRTTRLIVVLYSLVAQRPSVCQVVIHEFGQTRDAPRKCCCRLGLPLYL